VVVPLLMLAACKNGGRTVVADQVSANSGRCTTGMSKAMTTASTSCRSSASKTPN